MVSVVFKDERFDRIEVPGESRILDALVERDVGVKMLCGGRGICATCHIYVVKNADSLTPMTKREQLSLAASPLAKANSRLACQANLTDKSILIDLPQGLYIESLDDLQDLVGKRSKVPILHPVSGEILVEENKLIVRSMIMQLKGVDFSLRELQSNVG